MRILLVCIETQIENVLVLVLIEVPIFECSCERFLLRRGFLFEKVGVRGCLGLFLVFGVWVLEIAMDIVLLLLSIYRSISVVEEPPIQ